MYAAAIVVVMTTPNVIVLPNVPLKKRVQHKILFAQKRLVAKATKVNAAKAIKANAVNMANKKALVAKSKNVLKNAKRQKAKNTQ